MEHFFQNIQGWFIYAPVYDTAVQLAEDGAHFVEVGSWRGRSTAYMAVNIVNSGKKIKFDAVDTWRGSDEPEHKNDPAIINDTLYQEFLANMEPVKDVVNPVRASSMEAVKQYADESLDDRFVTIRTPGIEETLTVPTIRANHVLDMATAEAMVLLSVDVEGLDLQILQDIDFVKHRPVFIIVEPSEDYQPGSTVAIIDFLDSVGYNVVAETDVNLIFQIK